VNWEISLLHSAQFLIENTFMFMEGDPRPTERCSAGQAGLPAILRIACIRGKRGVRYRLNRHIICYLQKYIIGRLNSSSNFIIPGFQF